MLKFIKEEFVVDPVLIWNLNLDTLGFKLLSSESKYLDVSNFNLREFTSLIKPCFKDYFLNIFENFKVLLNDPFVIDCYEDFFLKVALPIQLNHNHFTYALLKIIPETTKSGEVKGVYFVLTPIKEYDNEIISVEVYRGFKKCYKATSFVKSEYHLNYMFTYMQQKIMNHLLNDKILSVEQIALYLDKKTINIKNSMTRIKDKLSYFFNMHFYDINEAVMYYKKCFY